MNHPHFEKNKGEFKQWMDDLADQFNRLDFITRDPIAIPHSFTRSYDIEIAGFFAAVLSWGNRTTILSKSRELLHRMDNKPYDFISGHSPGDLKQLEDFAHRTFNSTDLLFFVHRLKRFYNEEGSLEKAFFKKVDSDTEGALTGFRRRFFDDPFAPPRTGKHIASPEKGSACKRLNMFLRWMVRKDDRKVDLGIWTRTTPAKLYCPLDVHVARAGRELGLLTRKQNDWKACVELTDNLRQLDAEDPVKYDYALFGAGINKLL